MLLPGATLLLAPLCLLSGLYSIFTPREWSLGVKRGGVVGMLLLGGPCTPGSRALCDRCHPALLLDNVTTSFVICLHLLIIMPSSVFLQEQNFL